MLNQSTNSYQLALNESPSTVRNRSADKRTCNCGNFIRWSVICLIFICMALVMLSSVQVYQTINSVNYYSYQCFSTTSSNDYKLSYGGFRSGRFRQVSFNMPATCIINGMQTETTIWFPVDAKYHPPCNSTFTGLFNENQYDNGFYDNNIFPDRHACAIVLIIIGIFAFIMLGIYAFNPVWKYFGRTINNNSQVDIESGKVSNKVHNDTIYSSYNLMLLLVMLFSYSISWIKFE